MNAAAVGLWRLLCRRVARDDLDLATARLRPWLLTEPGPDLTDYLWRYRAPLAAWYTDLGPGSQPTAGQVADDLARRLVRWLQARNQFLDADPEVLAGVRGAYAACIVETRVLLQEAESEAALDTGLRLLLARHHDTLGALLMQAFGGRLRDAPWAEYTPALQMAVLGLGELLQDPILDVGCGAAGGLTLALRAAGHEVTGFDRDPQAPGVLHGDWLNFDYGWERWGTVVSHLGFSLHFLHQHLAGADAAFAYARTYRRILESLRPGGVFAYAPALPFMEVLLAPTFTALRSAWGPPGDGLLSACRVTRL